jgi:tetratricopeptide (TPR) repeat protein
MSARGKKRLALLVGGVVVAAAAVGGAVVVRDRIRASMMEQALAEGRAAYAAGDYELAMNRLGFYVGRADLDAPTVDGEAVYMLADARYREPMTNNQHLVRAAGLARTARQLMPDDPRPLQLLLRVYPALGAPNEAIDAADALLALTPGDPDAMQLKTIMLRMTGRRAEAMASAREMLRANPNSDAARAEIVVLMSLDGAEPDEIIAFLEEEVAANPEDLGAHLRLAQTQLAFNERDDALLTMQDARELEITTAEELARMVELLDRIGVRESGDASASILAADALLNGFADHPTLAQAASRIRAERLWRRGNINGALAVITPLVAAPDRADDATLGLACVLSIEAGELAAADAMHDELRSRSTIEASHWATLLDGRRALQQGEILTAIERLDEAEQIGQSPRLDLTNFWKGFAYALQDQRLESLNAYSDAMRAAPTWQLARAAVIDSLLREGRIEEATLQAQFHEMTSPNAEYSPDLGLAVTRLYAAIAQEGGVSTAGGGVITTAEAIEILGRNAQRQPNNGDLAGLYFVALLGDDRVAAAQAELDRMLDADITPNPGVYRQMDEAAAGVALTGLDRLVTAMAESQPLSPEVVFLRAMDAADAGRVDEGRAMFREALAQAGEGDRLAFERAQASFLVRVNPAEGVEALTRLATEHPSNPRVQMDLLNTDAAWTDERVISDAVTRLGAATNEGVPFQIFDARRLLTYLPEDGTARERAIASAFERLGRLLRTEPPVVQALVLGAEAELLSGDRAGAIEYFERAVEYEPERPGLYPRLIELLQSAGRSDDAERRLRDFVQLDDISELERRRRVGLLMRQGLWTLAVEDATELVADGGWLDMQLLAKARQGANDLDGAASAFRQMLETGEASTDAVQSAANFFGQRESFEAGLAVLEYLPERLTPEQRRLQVASYHQARGRTDEALRLTRSAVEEFGGAESWGELVRLLLKTGAEEEAQAALAAGVAAHPEDPLLTTMVALDQSGGAALTAEQAGALLGSPAADFRVETVRALVEARRTLQRDRNAGIAALRAVLADQPTFFQARQTLIMALLQVPEGVEIPPAQREREIDEALAAAQEGMVVEPTNPTAAQWAYEIATMLGRPQIAMAAAREWRDRQSLDTFLPDAAIADMLLQDGRAAEAYATIAPWRERLINEASDQRVQGLDLLGRVLAASGRADEAHALLWDRVQAAPEPWLPVYLRVARALSDAATMDAWVTRIEPLATAPQNRIALADVAFQAANIEASPERFQRVIDLAAPLATGETNSLAAMMLCGVSAEQLEDFEQAMQWYRRAVDAGAQEPIAFNNLAFLTYDAGGSVEEAIELAQRAVELGVDRGRAPAEQAIFHDTLAEILLKAGRIEEAERNARRAVEYSPGEARYRLNLAQALLAMDRYDEARQEATTAETLIGQTGDQAILDRLQRVQDALRARG